MGKKGQRHCAGRFFGKACLTLPARGGGNGIEALKKELSWTKQKILFVITIVSIVAFDQIAKYAAKEVLSDKPGMSAEFISGFIRFIYVENTGAAFSFFSGATGVLAVMSAAMAVVVIFLLFKTKNVHSRLCKLALCFIAGGAAGNLIDRVARGYVIDMLDFQFVDFAVFNVADSFISVGAVMLCVFIIWFWEKGRKSKNVPED